MAANARLTQKIELRIMTSSFTTQRPVLLPILAAGSEMRGHKCLCVLPDEAWIWGDSRIANLQDGPVSAIMPYYKAHSRKTLGLKSGCAEIKGVNVMSPERFS